MVELIDNLCAMNDDEIETELTPQRPPRRE